MVKFWSGLALLPTCKRLVAGAVPTLNLPEKSIPPTTSSAPRRELVRQELKPKPQYSNLEDLKKKVEKLNLSGWTRKVDANNVKFALFDEITHKRSIQYFTLSSLLSSLQELQLCGGL